MASVNKVIIIGNLGAAPELKYLPSGQAVCELRIATNEQWKDKDGAKQEKVEWHSVVTWAKTAENVAKFLEKGRSVYVEGRLQTRTWDDKNTGEKKYKTEIVAEKVVFLGGGGAASGQGGGKSGGGRGGDDLPLDGGDDDIPF